MRFLINPPRAAFSLAAAFIFLYLFIASCQSGKIVPLILYFALTLVYLGLTCYYTIFLEMDEKGVRNRFLFWSFMEIPWSEIKEVGIANMRVMKNAEKKKVGELYLYFSRNTMTEKERFYMCLHWPPKDKRYMRYSVDRLKKLHRYWEEKPVFAWLSEESYMDRYFRR